MKTNLNLSYSVFTALMFAMLIGFGMQASSAQADDRHTAPANLAIDMKQALDIASKAAGGPVSEIELEQENGQWVYEAELDLPNGGEKEILIDAQTGQVLKMEIENEENENDRD